MTQVFISYARTDQAVARRVANGLTSAGFDVWWDADLPAHRTYSEVIERHLKEAKAVVVLWSSAAAQSQWVRAEADVARNAGTLVQAQLDGTIPPLPFNQIQCADLKGWRGSAGHAGWTKVRSSVAALVSGEEVAAPIAAAQPNWWRQRRFQVAAAVAALLMVAALWLLPQWMGSDSERPVVAVLPFESLDRRDESLVAGIWEDTRQAIGRNPQLLVLGPNTAEEIAEKGGGTARKLADYLVEASVRSVGDRIRVSANLVRTEDGAELWNKNFDRRLDDVFALQAEIAGEIEGHIRGRLAERGGTLPENIATTGEVYALYSDARASIRGRHMDRYQDAIMKLRRVVKMDPNFAPGWATLAVAEGFADPSIDGNDGSRNSQAYARRAIALAPNLGAGHAALGLALGPLEPAAEGPLRKALQLDPNDVEAMNWLASNRSQRREYDEALRLYSRIVEIEPLWWPAVLNKINLLLDLGRTDEAQEVLENLREFDSGDWLITLTTVEIASRSGDLSTAAGAGLGLLNSAPDVDADMVRFSTFAVLMQLGHEQEARAVEPPPPFGPILWRDDPRGLDMVEALKLDPKTFFTMGPLPMNAGRVYVLSGRGTKLAELYREIGSSPDTYHDLVGSQGLIEMSPFIALGLRAAGDSHEADRLLAKAESVAIERGADRIASFQALLARIQSVQGRRAAALQNLSSAVNRGWLPASPSLRNDLALDPALQSLKGDPQFEQIRQRILGHIAKERAELGSIAVKYPRPQRH